MKKPILAAALISSVIAPSSSAAISLVAGATAGPHMFIGNTTTSKWNTVPAGAFANVYWDADADDIFGETAISENSGNAVGTLGFTINITDGSSYNFAIEGFSIADPTSIFAEFDIHKTDSSIERLTVAQGITKSFTDSNGDKWEVSYAFTAGGYGDVVKNIDSVPGGAAMITKASLPSPLFPSRLP
ncbi:MAG: hypothetical protein H7A51_14825 [Akkermansiaceae bacterium]|nr:hypothetical protein [Akkermansiaceae bacterium]